MLAKRRCTYIDNRGQQCDTWFDAIDSNKLCAAHKEIISPNAVRIDEDHKVKYIDLVNDERKYCYHFLDGTAENQSQELVFQFKDDINGSAFEKLDAHIAFLEKVLEDVKTRLHSSRAVRGEKLDSLSEEERKRLRAIKIDHAVREPKDKTPSFKADPVSFLAKKQGMSREDASALLTMDEDALIAKYAEMKRLKEENKEK